MALSPTTAHGGGTGTTIGRTQLVYRYTVSGSAKASIDTGSDTAQAGDNDWTGGDVLEVFMVMRTAAAGASDAVTVILNNDSGANYDRHYLRLINATVSGAPEAAQSFWAIQAHGNGGSAGYATAVRLSIPGYAGTTFNKTAEAISNSADATAGNNEIWHMSVGWRNTAAITRMKVTGSVGSLQVGSMLAIYKRLNA